MEGLTYLTVDGEAFEGDIYVPEGEGPWPVVVMFHGTPQAARTTPGRPLLPRKLQPPGCTCSSPTG